MPLSHAQTQALPGDSSGSRKRTHAQITRSDSPSQSPQPPTKRRRTMSSPSPQSSSSSISSTHSPAGVRFARDGLDFRRPIMSTTPRIRSQDHSTIDLTLDDDTPPVQPSTTTHTTEWFEISEDSSSDIQPAQRAPPFSGQSAHNNNQYQAVIDLLSDDDDDDDDDDFDGHMQAEGGTRLEPSSPEVEFVGARTLPQPAPTNPTVRRQLHLPPLPTLGHFGSMATFLGVTPNLFANLRGRREHPEVTLDRIDGFILPPGGVPELERMSDAFMDEYDGIEMDYGRAAFDFDRHMVVNLPNMPPNRPNESAYKEPLPPREGFTRNYEEDDMLICGLCGDELATGATEQKQQVWIIKQCGHAYCGDCAHNRNLSKQRNSKDTKRLTGKKNNGFKACAVPDCRRSVDSKTKMFQIYL